MKVTIYMIQIEISTEIFKYCVYIPDNSTTTTTATSTDTTSTDTTSTDTTTSTSTDTVAGNSKLFITTNCTNWFIASKPIIK